MRTATIADVHECLDAVVIREQPGVTESRTGIVLRMDFRGHPEAARRRRAVDGRHGRRLQGLIVPIRCRPFQRWCGIKEESIVGSSRVINANGDKGGMPMPTPEFVLELRKKIGHDLLWLNGVTGCVLDDQTSATRSSAAAVRLAPTPASERYATEDDGLWHQRAR